jgi:hypothetical protein
MPLGRRSRRWWVSGGSPFYMERPTEQPNSAQDAAQNNAELEAYNLLGEVREVLRPYADKTDADLGGDKIGELWDEVRVLKLKFTERLHGKGVLETTG